MSHARSTFVSEGDRHLPLKGLATLVDARIDALTCFGDAIIASFSTRRAGLPPGLWRIDPETGETDEIYTSDRIEPLDMVLVDIDPASLPEDLPLPRQDALSVLDMAMPSMAVYQGASDPHPCLYIGTVSAYGARLLRSQDGRTVEPVWESAEDGPVAFDCLAVWEGRLVVSCRGGTGPSIMVTTDPGDGAWQTLAGEDFGHVTALAVRGDRLKAALADPQEGFRLMSLAPGGGEADWAMVLDRGAERFGMNPRITAMASFEGGLFLGTGMPMPPTIDRLEWPMAELIALHDDGDWDLVVGEARLSHRGLRLPLAVMGAGFEADHGGHWVGQIVPCGGGLFLTVGPLPSIWWSRDGDDWDDLTPAELHLMSDDVADQEPLSAACAADRGIWVAVGKALYHFAAR